MVAECYTRVRDSEKSHLSGDSSPLSSLRHGPHAQFHVTQYQKFRYSITCRSSEEAVLHCLKALADYAEGGGHKNHTCLEASMAEWNRPDRVTLRFTSENNRSAFSKLARELLGDRWAQYDARDDDPPPSLGGDRHWAPRTISPSDPPRSPHG